MSKYRNKQNQKAAKVFKQGEPKFDYTSQCCGMPATKKACSKGNGEPDDKGFFLSPLGTWNCTKCRRKCKVTRTVRKKVEVSAQKLDEAGQIIEDRMSKLFTPEEVADMRPYIAQAAAEELRAIL